MSQAYKTLSRVALLLGMMLLSTVSVLGAETDRSHVQIEQNQTAPVAPVDVKDYQVLLDLDFDSENLKVFFAEKIEFQDSFGGLYIDHASGGQLVLQLVRNRVPVDKILPALPPLRHPNRLRVELVDWPYQKLQQQFNFLSESLAPYASFNEIFIDEVHNQVVTTISPSVVGAARGSIVDKNNLPSGISELLSDPAVVVKAGGIEVVDTAVVGGQGWNTSGNGAGICTLGFEATFSGGNAMVTAGHCLDDFAANTRVYYTSSPIGRTSIWQNGAPSNSGIGIDGGLIRMDASHTATDNIGPSLDIGGAVSSNSYTTGAIRCYWGKTSNKVCSAIAFGSFTFQDPNTGRWFRDMFLTGAIPQGGDSGGPVFQEVSPTSAAVAGIVKGQLRRSTDNTVYGVHSKWSNIAAQLGATLVTTD